jgi:hypothetical protein
MNSTSRQCFRGHAPFSTVSTYEDELSLNFATFLFLSLPALHSALAPVTHCCVRLSGQPQLPSKKLQAGSGLWGGSKNNKEKGEASGWASRFSASSG